MIWPVCWCSPDGGQLHTLGVLLAHGGADPSAFPVRRHRRGGGAVRYKRSKRVCAMLGTIFSIGGAVLYYMLRYQWGFTLFGMLV